MKIWIQYRPRVRGSGGPAPGVGTPRNYRTQFQTKKHAIFDTRFQTWPLKSIPVLRPFFQ